MSAHAYAITGAACGLCPWLLFLVWRLWPRPDAAPVPALPISTGPETDAYLPCHTTRCAHLERPHDRTPAGLTCRHCHHTVTEVPRA